MAIALRKGLHKTFLFTSIENTAYWWKQDPTGMQAAISQHDNLTQTIVRGNGGRVFKITGDNFFCVFDNVTAALTCALTIQRTIIEQLWNHATISLKVGMVIHTGPVEEWEGDYRGEVLDRTIALLAAANGGQILLSQAASTIARQTFSGDVVFEDMGKHYLNDLLEPELLTQVSWPTPATTFPPLKSLNNYLNNLPSQDAPLLGRETEVAQACRLLLNSQGRLLTLFGPGGTGKTRLGLQIAARLLADFPDGVFFVDLSPLHSVLQVAQALIQVLELKEGIGNARGQYLRLEENLKTYLKTRQVLLLLDNFEHVLDATSLVNQLLGAAPNLRIIVTTRSVLKIYGEQEFPVLPLKLPDASRLPSIDDLAGYSAVALFIRRAKQAQPAFQLTEENAGAVVNLCRALDGLPLAIELAAARASSLTPHQMLDQLSNRLAWLEETGRGSNRPLRQQSLHEAIAWGYDLLEENEQVIFTRLAVFSGGCVLEAAEAVCDPDFTGDIDVLDGITILLNSSLLRRVEGVGGEPRFIMLQTIHQYALDKLVEQGEEEAVRSWHARYYGSVVQDAGPKLTGPDQAEWFRRLEQEYDNLRSLMEWALSGSDQAKIEQVLEISCVLWRFWAAQGYQSDGLSWLEQAFSKSSGIAVELLAKTYNVAGIMCRDQFDYPKAIEFFQAGLALQRKLGDKAGIAAGLHSLGTVAAYMGNYDQAVTYHEEAMALRRALDDQRGLALSLSFLGALKTSQGEFVPASQFYEEGLRLLRKLGDLRTTALLLNNLGYLRLSQGLPALARPFFEESLALRRELHDRSGTAGSILGLADAYSTENNSKQAFKLYCESFQLSKETGESLNLVFCLEGIARILSQEGLDRLACFAFGTAEAFRESINTPIQPTDLPGYNQSVEKVRTQLHPATFENTWLSGRLVSPEEALKVVLDEVPLTAFEPVQA
ncbi:MAG: adenylate/guanylate cyclase protein [Chloroflexi bacterium]|jgi:predicted ATPase/class 3 adenylate cyclase|nr:adenylate/guanylate cyclase protein [Chloroflexota bacterium]